MEISGTGMSSMAGLAQSAAKQTFGAQVVAKTLDYMNSGSSGGTGKDADYDFQTKVLTAGAVLKGGMIDSNI